MATNVWDDVGGATISPPPADASAIAAAASAAAALVSQNAAAASVALTNADVLLTNADVLLTHADVVLTHADVVLTAADRVQTGLDRVATAADRVQTGIDAAAAAASAASIANLVDSVLALDITAGGPFALTLADAGKTNHEYSGTPAAPVTITIPDAFVHNFTGENLTGQPITIKTVTGTGITIPAGKLQQLYSNGVNVEDSNSVKADGAATAAALTLRVTKDSDTGAMRMPAGTTLQRPAVPIAGDTRLNSDTGKSEIFNGTTWGAMGGGATGGGSDAVFVENDQVVTTDYTITAGKNAHSVGPITINTGITVTVPTGSTWAIS